MALNVYTPNANTPLEKNVSYKTLYQKVSWGKNAEHFLASAFCNSANVYSSLTKNREIPAISLADVRKTNNVTTMAIVPFTWVINSSMPYK